MVNSDKSVSQRVVSNLVWVVLGEGVAKGLFLVVNFHLARTLQVENFGLFSLAYSLGFQGWLIAELGIGMYGIREVASSKNKVSEIVAPLVTLRILGGLAGMSIFVLCASLLPLEPLTRSLVFAAGSFVLARTLYTDWILRGLERFQDIAVGHLATFLPMSFLTFVLVDQPSHLIRAVYIWSLSVLGGAIALALVVRFRLGPLPKVSITLKELWSHLRHSCYFMLENGFKTLTAALPIFILGWIGSRHELGIFSAAQRLILIIIVSFSLISQTLYPVLSQLVANSPLEFLRVQRLYGLFALGAGLGLASLTFLFAEDLVRVLYGPDYLEATYPLRILCLFCLLVLAFRHVLLITLSATHRQHFNALAGLVGMAGFLVAAGLLFRLTALDNIGVVAVSLLVSECAVVATLAGAWFGRPKELGV